MVHTSLRDDLFLQGFSKVPGLLTQGQCEELQGLYGEGALFRSIINMQRYRFGKGEYKYFAYPLPGLLQELRSKYYTLLAPVANAWMQALNIETVYPEQHEAFLKQCHDHKQLRPTPLVLRYEAGGYNTLHQDLYGQVYFPFQMVLALSQPGRDYEGGEFVMTEQVPRAQSKAQVIPLNQGDALIFTTNFRPVQGARGYYRAAMKHGVSEVRSGVRYALGIIFHDAT
jgi:hypothetical protein